MLNGVHTLRGEPYQCLKKRDIHYMQCINCLLQLSGLWSKMSGIRMVGLNHMIDHLKTGQKVSEKLNVWILGVWCSDCY